MVTISVRMNALNAKKLALDAPIAAYVKSVPTGSLGSRVSKNVHKAVQINVVTRKVVHARLGVGQDTFLTVAGVRSVLTGIAILVNYIYEDIFIMLD